LFKADGRENTGIDPQTRFSWKENPVLYADI